jgi:hypothetical protein
MANTMQEMTLLFTPLRPRLLVRQHSWAVDGSRECDHHVHSTGGTTFGQVGALGAGFWVVG